MTYPEHPYTRYPIRRYVIVIGTWPQEFYTMALIWNYRFSSQSDSTRVLGEATFTDGEEARLRAYDQYTDELREISILKHDAPDTLQLRWSEEEGLSVTTELPTDEQVFALLYRLRPFVLDDEDTSFRKVSNIVARRADNELVRSCIQVQKDLYASKPSQQGCPAPLK